MENARILVVEDDLMISELVRFALTKGSEEDGCEYDIALAHDGVQGLELVWKLRPDVIVLDIQMPKLDGYGVLKTLRSMGDTTPVIMMTATPRQEDQVNGFLAGCDAYITKPFR